MTLLTSLFITGHLSPARGIIALLLFTLCISARAKSPSPQSPLISQLELKEKRITLLEKENDLLERQVSELSKAKEELAAEVAGIREEVKRKTMVSLSEILPEDEGEKKSFFQTFRREMRSEGARSSGPWTTQASWNSIRKRMTTFEVRKALGNPTRIKQSANPAVEYVYLYEGDLDADGKKESGYVNFKEKRVVSFQSPH